MRRACVRKKIPMNRAWHKLTAEQKKFIIEGEDKWYGVNGFFEWLEKKRYKAHVRIFLARYRGYTECRTCKGTRYRSESLCVSIQEKNIADLSAFSIHDLFEWFHDLKLDEEEQHLSKVILKEIGNRLQFLINVGLGYLSLGRQARTLSGGESQRIALATSLGASLTDTLYVLDEPSIGLHPRDHQKLIEVLMSLRNLGNTIVVVEHDPKMIQHADRVLDMGPKAGHEGGELIFEGTVTQLQKHPASLTGRYLNVIPATSPKRRKFSNQIQIEGARIHNIKDLTLAIPLEVICAITGVSGAGKSSLIHHILYAGYLSHKKRKAEFEIGHFKSLKGFEFIDDMVLMDQSPVGKSLRSNIATYMGFYQVIRQLFSLTRQARHLGLTPGHFSFNVKGGRCETCMGAGIVTVDMQFLEDITMTCEACHGKRFNPKVTSILYHGKSIVDILNMTGAEAKIFFSQKTDRRDLIEGLHILEEVGLDYIPLGQTTSTLSGGEAQRLKLASRLAKKEVGGRLFIFDEPTTGLHPYDIEKLKNTFQRLIDAGSSVLVIEHNLDVIYHADYVLDLGPEGGDGGGQLVAEGMPEVIMKGKASYTGHYLREYLGQ